MPTLQILKRNRKEKRCWFLLCSRRAASGKAPSPAAIPRLSPRPQAGATASLSGTRLYPQAAPPTGGAAPRRGPVPGRAAETHRLPGGPAAPELTGGKGQGRRAGSGAAPPRLTSRAARWAPTRAGAGLGEPPAPPRTRRRPPGASHDGVVRRRRHRNAGDASPTKEPTEAAGGCHRPGPVRQTHSSAL